MLIMPHRNEENAIKKEESTLIDVQIFSMKYNGKILVWFLVMVFCLSVVRTNVVYAKSNDAKIATEKFKKEVKRLKKQCKEYDEEYLAYAIKDISGDGVPELYTVRKYESLAGLTTLCSVYVYSKKEKNGVKFLCSNFSVDCYLGKNNVGDEIYYSKKMKTVSFVHPDYYDYNFDTGYSLDFKGSLGFPIFKIKGKKYADRSVTVDMDDKTVWEACTYNGEDGWCNGYGMDVSFWGSDVSYFSDECGKDKSDISKSEFENQCERIRQLMYDEAEMTIKLKRVW